MPCWLTLASITCFHICFYYTVVVPFPGFSVINENVFKTMKCPEPGNFLCVHNMSLHMESLGGRQFG